MINVDFQGFQKAVDAIGCIYADIDRRYFNDSARLRVHRRARPATRSCAARRRSSTRASATRTPTWCAACASRTCCARPSSRSASSKLVDDRDKLIKIFGKYTTSDAELKTRSGILRLLKLAVFSVDQPIREVHFEGQITAGDARQGAPSYVTASNATVKKLTRQFLGVEETRGAARRAAAQGPQEAQARRARSRATAAWRRRRASARTRRSRRSRQGAGGQLPVYYPTVRVKNSLFAGPPRYYKIVTRDGKRHKSYRMVVKRGLVGEYYGVQGTTWKDPPILDEHVREAQDRQAHVRAALRRRPRCGWWPGARNKAVYWVSNTLLQTLTERQMLAIARSTRLP